MKLDSAATFGRTVVLELPGVKIEGGLEMDDFSLSIVNQVQRYSWTAATLKPLRVSSEAAPVRAQQAQLGPGHIDIGSDQSIELAVDGIELRGLTTTLPSVSAELERLAVEKLEFGESGASVRGVACEGVQVEWTRSDEEPERAPAGDREAPESIVVVEASGPVEAAALGAAEIAAPDEEPAAEADAETEPAIDWGFLDALDGRLHADVILSYRAKVVGNRRATHRFRVPIEGGRIDFKTLEKGLSRLENTVLDFELVSDALILEKDIPLLPFDSQALVRWPLPPDERTAAAKDGKVRVARLLTPEIPEKKADRKRSGKRPSFELGNIVIEPLEIDASLAGGHALRGRGMHIELGSEDEAAVESLQVRAKLAMKNASTPPAPAAPAASAPGQDTDARNPAAPGEEGAAAVAGAPVKLGLEALRARVVSLALGERQLRQCPIQASGVEAALFMEGFRPTGLSVRVDSLRLSEGALSAPDGS